MGMMAVELGLNILRARADLNTAVAEGEDDGEAREELAYLQAQGVAMMGDESEYR